MNKLVSVFVGKIIEGVMGFRDIKVDFMGALTLSIHTQNKLNKHITSLNRRRKKLYRMSVSFSFVYYTTRVILFFRSLIFSTKDVKIWSL